MLTPITTATTSYMAGIVLIRFSNIEKFGEVLGISVKKSEKLKKYISVN